MLERALILVGLAVVGLAVALLARAWARWRAARVMRSEPQTMLHALTLQPDGRPSVVAFSTPSCAACHVAQVPALDVLQRRLRQLEVRVLEIDAAARPELARQFGVLTVPTTVVLGGDGRVLAVNHGFASADKLARQITAAA